MKILMKPKFTLRLKWRTIKPQFIKSKINDRTWDYGNAKVYGPYPKNKDITVSATGKVKGKTFETETKSIKADKLTDNTDVTVSFDDDDISDYIEKKEKEDNSLKNKLGSFSAVIHYH